MHVAYCKPYCMQRVAARDLAPLRWALAPASAAVRRARFRHDRVAVAPIR